MQPRWSPDFCQRKTTTKMKTIFITGASTGLGKATAKLFAREGWNVIATMRNPKNENELRKTGNVSLLKLDVTNLDEIDSAVQNAIGTGVDVVFNNAGYGLMGPLEGTSDVQIVRQINTNLLGVIRVTKAFLPYFRQKQTGLFISTTSLGGHVAFPFSSLYHATKWAIEGWSESMSFELKKIGVTVKTVCPGAIQTDYLRRSAEFARHPAYQSWMDQLFSHINEEHFTPADQIARVVYDAATDGTDKLRYFAGEDAKALYAKRLAIGDEEFRKFMFETFLGN
jgi:NAD(P)-dependent dehydrogenase (short-subunit alcohol dehydrogenase family)